MDKNIIEKSLKRFLKKKVSYTTSLLVAFLISGQVINAEDLELKRIDASREQILRKIRIEKSKIRRKITANEAKIKEYNKQMYTLVSQGDFYSKPLMPSTQIFFSFHVEDDGEGEDRTSSAYAETIRAVEQYYGKESVITLPDGTEVKLSAEDRVRRGNGVVVDDKKFRESIDLGVNIKLLQPELPSINPSVSVAATVPTVSVGGLPQTVTPKISPLDPPIISTPGAVTAPTVPTISVTAPASVSKIGKISSLMPPAEPEQPKEIKIGEPATPESYNPRQITKPVINVHIDPKIKINKIGSYKGFAGTLGAIYDYWGDDDVRGEKRTMIDQISIKTGQFKVTAGDDTTSGKAYIRNYTGELGLNYTTSPSILGTNAVGNPSNIKNPTVPTNIDGPTLDPTSSTGFKYGNQLKTPYFMGITGTAYTHWDKNVNISWFGNGNQLIYADIQKASTKKLSDIKTEGNIAADIYNDIDTNMKKVNYDDTSGGISLHNSEAEINLFGNETKYIATTCWPTAKGRVVVFNNNGIINGMNSVDGTSSGSEKQVLYYSSPDMSKRFSTSSIIRTLFLNSKDVNLYGNSSIGMFYTSNQYTQALPSYNASSDEVSYKGHTYKNSGKTDSNGNTIYETTDKLSSHQKDIGAMFINNGTFNLYGKNSNGVVVGTIEEDQEEKIQISGNTYVLKKIKSEEEVLSADSGFIMEKPLNIYGDNSTGIYIAGNIDNVKDDHNIVKVHIGENKNNPVDAQWKDIETNNTVTITTTGDATGNATKVENSIGVYYNNSSQNAKIQAQDITLGQYSKDGIGIFSGDGKLTVTNGNININAGEGNIALASKKDTASDLVGGDIDYTGNININSVGTGNNEILPQNTFVSYTDKGKITINGNIDMKAKDSQAFVAKDTGVINVPGNLKVNISGKDAMGAYAVSNGQINLSSTASLNLTATTGENINIVGDKLTGTGLYSEGGSVEAKNRYIKIKDTQAGIISKDTGSKIDISNSRVEYDGDGFALYAENGGKIIFKDGRLVLKGKATVLERDLATYSSAPNTDPIDGTNTKIEVHSNDVVLANLTHATGFKVSTLDTQISGAMGNMITDEAASTVHNYIKAAITGGDLTIDKDIDKSNTTVGTNNYIFSRQLLVQGIKMTLQDGKNIDAKITDTDASTNFKDQVVGIALSSNKDVVSSSHLSNSAEETEIKIGNNSKINVDRVGGTKGSIGTYINYGKITLGKSEINVETSSDTPNEKSIGIFGVNGSIIDAKAGSKVTVKGDRSIGILGLAYREDNTPAHNPITDEFKLGTVTHNKQGEVNITNAGEVTLDGVGSIGIYAKNNEPNSPNKQKVNITNDTTGKISVGASDSTSTAIGMYGTTATITNKGEIEVGKGSVGIYGKDNSEIKDIGTVTLDEDSVAVTSDNTTTITGTNLSLKEKSTSNGKQKIGLYLAGDSTHTSKAIGINIDGKDTTKGILVYSKDFDLTSNGNLKVGQDGIGIYTENKKATNTGNIDLEKSNAIGMYSKTTDLLNKGIITSKVDKQIGAYIEGSHTLENIGIIDLQGDNSIGLFSKGGTVNLNSGNNIKFNGKNEIGVYDKGGNVNVNDNIGFTEDNENKNIYIYGEGSNVNIASGKTFTVDGVGAPTTSGNSTVGIYLDNGSNLSMDGKIDVKNKAIGIYSHNSNNLKLDVDATGAGTTGIYVEDGSTLNGKLNVDDKAVGVYAINKSVMINPGLDITTKNLATGMYLTDGAYADGADINVTNGDTNQNIALYYDKGTGSAPITNKVDLNLNGGHLVGIYATNGIQLTNDKNIVTDNAGNNVLVYVDKGSIYTSKGNLDLKGTLDNGIVVADGNGINEGTINLDGTQNIGMIAKADSGKNASVENKGTINANSNVGIYVGGSGASTGKNSDTINVKKGTGVFVEGNKTFTGTGGTIDATQGGTAVFLKDVSSTTGSDFGNIKIANDGVAYYAQNSTVDFAINTSSQTGGVGLVAEGGTGTTNVNKDITTGKDSISVYLKDSKVTFNNVTVETGGKGTSTSTGVYVDKGISGYTLSGITIDGKDGVGLYLGNDATTASTTATTGANITFTGTVKTENGIGIYVPEKTTLTTNNANIDINGGIGIYLKQGTANLGTTGNLAFNFGANNGIGIFQDGGTLNMGTNITTTGSGSLLATRNGSVVSNGTLNIGEGAVGIYGEYGAGTTSPKTVENGATGDITVTSGGIGIAAMVQEIGGTPSLPTAIVTAKNSGKINVSGVSSANIPSIGIYSNIANVENNNTISVGDKAIGIYAASTNGMNPPISIKNSNTTITGNDAVGLYVKGASAGITTNNITSSGVRNTGVALDGVNASNMNVGNVSLGDESIGVYSTAGTNTTLNGNVTVGKGTPSKNSIGVAINGGSNIIIDPNMKIKAGDKGVGIFTENSTLNASNIGNISVGNEGVYLYSKNSNITIGGSANVDNQIGLVVDGGSINANPGTTLSVKNNGLGAYVKGTSATGLNNITFNVLDGTASDKAIGVYYDHIPGTVSIPVVNQKGNNNLGVVLDATNGTAISTTLTSAYHDQVGIYAKNGSTLSVNSVNSDGDRNIGVYGENSDITTNNITVGHSNVSPNKKDSAIGVYLDGGSFNGSGDILVGDNSIGLFAKNISGKNVTFNGNSVKLGDSSVGIYAEGLGTGNEKLDVTTSNGIVVGKDSSVGISAKNMNLNVKGNLSVGANTSVGIAQEGKGDLNYSGDITTNDKINTGSIGVYKANGTGNVVTNGNWNIGKGGYGVYLKQTAGDSATVINNANMVLGMSGIGVYSAGTNNVVNNGDITVGKTDLGASGSHFNGKDHLNSVALYAENGTKLTNNGKLSVKEDHSVGIYGQGAGTQISNKGTIDIDNGATGILVRDNAVAINEAGAKITLGSRKASCGSDSVGMAAYDGATIINKGTIDVGEGVGMYVNALSTVDNQGVINVNNGIGIKGQGTVLNKGTINVTGLGTDMVGGTSVADVGAVKIDSLGNININGSYVSVGGTLVTDKNVNVNGAYIDIVSMETPVFKAPSVSGEVNILPNFATTGNGLTWEVKNFVDTATATATTGSLTPVVSPLYVSKVTNDGSLMIAKRPYEDITLGNQFDELNRGLDNILKQSNGKGKDAEALMKMNGYLASIKDEQTFRDEAGKMVSETRGDIYSTIQKRMQNVDKAFDRAFEELETSYNFSKDTDKYSVIYSKGKFKDGTMGIDDYKYDTVGLLYMKEKEKPKLDSKYGYSFGFAGSRFKFDDGGSKEDVYSIRAGAHNVENLSTRHKVSWLTRGELGYNRHEAKRKINLDEDYRNKAGYNTYTVGFDNKISKNVYADFETKLNIYADMNLQYGILDGFKEKSGTLKVKVKDNDYFSAEAGVGVNGSRRVYLGKRWSTKLSGDVKYAYELGENYEGNKAKLKDGGEGYYKLITPEKEKGKLVGKAAITFERANEMGVSFEVEGKDSDSKEKPSVTYGVRFNYKFFNDND